MLIELPAAHVSFIGLNGTSEQGGIAEHRLPNAVAGFVPKLESWDKAGYGKDIRDFPEIRVAVRTTAEFFHSKVMPVAGPCRGD